MRRAELEMTPLERSAAYAAGQEVDRIPTALSASETASPLIGNDICDYYFSADAMVQIESFLAENTQADNLGMGLGLRTVAEALGTQMAYPKRSVSYVEKPRLQSFAEADNLSLIDIDKDGRLPIMCEAFARLREKYDGRRGIGSGLASPFTTAGNLIGTEKLLKGTRKDREGAHHLLQVTTDIIVDLCRAMNVRLGLKFALSEPMGSQDLVSKAQFDEFVLPYVRQCVERMNEFQGSTSLHICGHTRDRWDEVAGSGIASFWVDNCESLADLSRQYGGRIAVQGNVPPYDALCKGTPVELTAAVRDCLEAAASNPCGFLLCPGCTTPIGTSLDNMIAFTNAAAVYGRGAKKGCRPAGLEDSRTPAELVASFV